MSSEDQSSEARAVGRPPLLLSFDFIDPTGAAGLQADLLTAQGLGTHLLSVATALTVQDSSETLRVQAIDTDLIEEQARALLEDMPVDAIKIGCLPNIEVATALAEILSDYPGIAVVLAHGNLGASHDEAHDMQLRQVIVDLLLPQTTLLVLDARHAMVYLEEADELEDDLKQTESGERDAAAVAAAFCELGCDQVLLCGLIEGGHQINALYDENGRRQSWRRAAVAGVCRGESDVLSAALAAGLAAGDDLLEMAAQAHEFASGAVASAYRPGMGPAVPDLMFWARSDADTDNAPGARETSDAATSIVTAVDTPTVPSPLTDITARGRG